MSELSLIPAPSPELFATATAVAKNPANAAPGSAAKPFADLLSGMLAGAQPLAPAAAPLPGIELPDTDPDTDTDADPLATLALPGSAAPPPALPGEFAVPVVAGNSLPVAGNPLPADPSLRVAPGTASPGPVSDPPPTQDDQAPVETRSRIALTDLALRRQLEPVPEPTGAIGRASIDSNGPAPQGQRTHDSASAALAFARKYLAQRPQAQSVAPTAATSELPAPAAGTEFTAGMLAALTAGNASTNGLRSPAPLAVTDVAASGNVPLVVRQDGGTPPALQPLGDPGSFAGGLADRLLALGGPGVQTARLQLHPEKLGALTVEIQIEDGTAQVWFGTSTSQAHSAIEGSLPRLRELFADQGIVLTRTQVDVGTGQLGNSGSDQQRRSAGSTRTDVDAPWQPATPVRSVTIPGLLRSVGAPTRRLDVWA